ncbi:MAG: SGNH/GDSL hydrolase family protein [Ferruginibacter sp.]
MKNGVNYRRQFIKNITALGALSLFEKGAADALPQANSREESGTTILFQGDSITDGNRTRNYDWNHVMGHGYQYIIASKLWYDYPEKGFHFFNRGISGNKVTDLAARWQQDTIELKPDAISILIGINDVSSFINGNNSFSADQYELGYRSLLYDTKKLLPGIKFILCEPFILPVGKVKEQWQDYSTEVQKRRIIVKKLSTEYNTVFVEFQNAFNKALTKAPAEYWIWDGIHPMPAGHQLMAVEWMRQAGKKLKFNR